ncbi:hypothetical protein NC651_028583 [Populus alba x Populus x berolinensis]|nr:hypothetical protein NC651_028583 [Populus alba x Populus x berolinensis]
MIDLMMFWVVSRWEGGDLALDSRSGMLLEFSAKSLQSWDWLQITWVLLDLPPKVESDSFNKRSKE